MASSKNPAFFNMKARSAYAIDAESGQVLYQKNATKRYPIDFDTGGNRTGYS